MRYYYWEIIIMYRKLSLIFIAVFLVEYGVVTQVMIICLIVIFVGIGSFHIADSILFLEHKSQSLSDSLIESV